MAHKNRRSSALCFGAIVPQDANYIAASPSRAPSADDARYTAHSEAAPHGGSFSHRHWSFEGVHP